MDQDDTPVGRLLTRRETLALLGWAGAAVWLGVHDAAAQGLVREPGASSVIRSGSVRPAPGACVVRPEQTEGPYFVDEELNRTDLRKDPASGAQKSGAALGIAFRVSRIVNGECRPLPNARVDLWHCDAAGVYSDVRDPRFDTTGQKFLRGYQVTDESGAASFTTLYPGWYPGRTVHIHFKVRTNAGSRRGEEFTSQLYFDDAVTDRVHTAAPYVKTGRRVRNERDGIFRSGGDQLTLAVQPSGASYRAAFDLALESA